VEKKSDRVPDATNQAGPELLNRLLGECVRAQASDMHLSSGRAPYLRVEGGLSRNRDWAH
jgi:Tfp pilus assembly pilus retraction ATPase PilT